MTRFNPAAAAMLLALAACNKPATEPNSVTIDNDAATPNSTEVLPPDEYDDEHLPGAINIPLKTIDRETTRQLDRTKPVIVYCYDYQ